jgi:hypothetical protein
MLASRSHGVSNRRTSCSCAAGTSWASSRNMPPASTAPSWAVSPVAQVADLRGQIHAINERLDQTGLRPGLNLAARFEDLAAPRGLAAPSWIGLDRDTYATRLLAPPHSRHLGAIHPGRRMAPHLQWQTPRPGPGSGVLRTVAARHHAPHHRHHPPMRAAVREAPRLWRLGCSSRIPLAPASPLPISRQTDRYHAITPPHRPRVTSVTPNGCASESTAPSTSGVPLGDGTIELCCLTVLQ